jgi:tRNA modification GTPase
LSLNDTVAAVATPRGLGGVGIVRVSGPLVSAIAEAVLGEVPTPRYATFSCFHAADGSCIDQGIALLFARPHSFTGEDVLELQGHGGPVVMDALLQRCLQLGARHARPGEFSERAFLNGKLDLTQAEAIADLIESSTALAAKLAVRSLQGAFSQRIHSLVHGVVHLRTYLEATLDFPDDELDLRVEPIVLNDLDAILAEARLVLGEAYQGERIRDGFTVAIAGPPNAGKSSLLNALSLIDAAIVTPIPGTTRDLLRVDIQVDGLPVHLVDTAGLRATMDPVESEGVRRARDQIGRSDLVLWVYDATQGCEESALQDIPAGIPVTLIRNKIDLLAADERAQAFGTDEIAISARTGEGLDRLNQHIKARAGVDSMIEGAFVARRRHLEALERGLSQLESARVALMASTGPEIVAVELASAQKSLGEITGEFTTDDLLERIFASFCIGK